MEEKPSYPYSQTTTPVVTAFVNFGENPMQVTCGNCNQTIVTRTSLLNGVAVWIAVLFIAMIFFPFFWVPLCIDNCKDVHHICPSCGVELGVHKRI